MFINVKEIPVSVLIMIRHHSLVSLYPYDEPSSAKWNLSVRMSATLPYRDHRTRRLKIIAPRKTIEKSSIVEHSISIELLERVESITRVLIDGLRVTTHSTKNESIFESLVTNNPEGSSDALESSLRLIMNQISAHRCQPLQCLHDT